MGWEERRTDSSGKATSRARHRDATGKIRAEYSFYAGVTVSAACRQMIEQSPVVPATAAARHAVCRTSIAPFFVDQTLSALTPHQVRAWIAWLHDERQLAASTIRAHVKVLAAVTAEAVRSGLLHTDPVARVRLPAVPRPAMPRFTAAPRPALPSGTAGQASGHSRRLDVVSAVKAALREGGRDLRVVFRAPDVD